VLDWTRPAPFLSA